MTRDEAIMKIQGITNVNKQVGVIYDVLDGLGIKYQKTACSRCRKDLLLIAKEELGLIESAADESEYNENRHLELKRTIILNGKKVTNNDGQETLQNVKEALGAEWIRYFVER